VREVARKLNVTSVLEGSVQTASNRLRISVKLVDSAAAITCGPSSDRDPRDLFTVQTRLPEAS
jgi:TolB-like protein